MSNQTADITAEDRLSRAEELSAAVKRQVAKGNAKGVYEVLDAICAMMDLWAGDMDRALALGYRDPMVANLDPIELGSQYQAAVMMVTANRSAKSEAWRMVENMLNELKAEVEKTVGNTTGGTDDNG